MAAASNSRSSSGVISSILDRQYLGFSSSLSASPFSSFRGIENGG